MLIPFATVTIWLSIQVTSAKKCKTDCPEGEMTCGLDIKRREYKMFPSECALYAYSECHEVDITKTPLNFCIEHVTSSARRMYGESCPVFCPQHYRPVCGASKMRSYVYRTFINGCYLDMINCRGEDEYTGYVEVPLNYCQRHLMKNIFKEQVVVTNIRDFNQDF